MDSQTTPAGWRWIKLLAGLWLLAASFAAACYAAWDRKIDVHAEGGPLEIAQLVSWIVVIVLSVLAIGRSRHWRDRLSASWIATLALLAAARELDLHESVRHGNSILPPVLFRLDWLTDPAQPLWAKAFWVGLLGLLGVGLIAPMFLSKAPTVRLLRAGDAPTCLVFIGLGLLGAGYLTDDILGRGRLGIHYEVTQGIEEVIEFCGVLAFVLVAWYEFRAPLSARVAALASTSSRPLPSPGPGDIVIESGRADTRAGEGAGHVVTSAASR